MANFAKDNLFNIINFVVMIGGFAYGFGGIQARLTSLEESSKDHRVEESVSKLADTVAKDHDVLVKLVTMMEGKK